MTTLPQLTQETVQKSICLLRDQSWMHPGNWKSTAYKFIVEAKGKKVPFRTDVIIAELNLIADEKFKAYYIKKHGAPITTCQDVFDEVLAGKNVCWINNIYVVKSWKANGKCDFNIICTCSEMCHGLIAKDETTFTNGDEAKHFYVA
jgi:hypothetical protein